MLVIIKRREISAFPWFFSYTVFSVLVYGLRFAATGHKGLQFEVYWATDAMYAVLGIAVMYEVYRTVFSGIAQNTQFRYIYPVTMGLIIVLSLLFTFFTPFALHQHRVVRWIIAGELGARVVQVGTFVLMVTSVFVLGLRWREQAFGISAGFGIYSTVALLAFTKYYEIGTKFLLPWNVLSVAAYNFAVLIWLWYFTGAPVPDRPRASVPPLSMRDLEGYRHVLRKVRRP